MDRVVDLLDKDQMNMGALRREDFRVWVSHSEILPLDRRIDMEEPEELADAMSMTERELDITEDVMIECKLVRLRRSLKCLKVEPLAIYRVGPRHSARNIELGAQRHTYPKRSGIVDQSTSGMMDRCWTFRAFCMN